VEIYWPDACEPDSIKSRSELLSFFKLGFCLYSIMILILISIALNRHGFTHLIYRVSRRTHPSKFGGLPTNKANLESSHMVGFLLYI